MNPKPPFVVIHQGKSFWVEERTVNEWRATLQAFHDGCFKDACCYDATGGLWPVLSAGLRQPPSFVQRLLPWRQVPVEIRLGARSEPDLRDVIRKLEVVLRSESDFSESLDTSPTALLERLEGARMPLDVIRIVSESTDRNTAQPRAGGRRWPEK